MTNISPNNNRKVLILGGTGFFGGAITDQFVKNGWITYIYIHNQYNDLKDYERFVEYLKHTEPELIINCAALSGGILWNQQFCDQIYYDNVLMTINVMKAASLCHSVHKCINIVSSCSYPDIPNAELKESDFWNGLPNKSVRFFGLQKRNMVAYSMALNKQYSTKRFICPIVNNLYGPLDTFDLLRTKVVGAFINKCIDAKEKDLPFFDCFGSGKPLRQFTYVHDAAEAIYRIATEYVLDKDSDDDLLVNVSTKQEVSIIELAETIKRLVDYHGYIRNIAAQDGQYRKYLNCDRIYQRLGWEAATSLEEGLKETIQWYIKNKDDKIEE